MIEMAKRIIYLAFLSAILLASMTGNFITLVGSETAVGVNGDLELRMTLENTTIPIGKWVNITLTLSNIGSSTINVSFLSSQCFDIYLYWERMPLVPISKWSNDKVFAQVVWNLSLDPGKNFTELLPWNFYIYNGSFYFPPIPGNYYLEGLCVGTPAVKTPKLPIKLITGPTAPTASFTFSPPVSVVNWTVTFNASTSLPGWNGTHEAPIVFYQWNFGDGTPIPSGYEDPIIAHNYTTAGNYTVELTVYDSQGLWNTTSKSITVYASPFHDVAIVSIMPMGIPGMNFAYAKWHPTLPYGFYIEVVVKNNGTFTENNVVVGLYNDSTLIGASTVTIAPQEEYTEQFPWIPLQIKTFPEPMRHYPWPYPTRILKANVTVVAGDVNITNNEYVFGNLTIRYPGDADGNGGIWVKDLYLVGKAWGSDRSKPGKPKTRYELFGYCADFNHDGKVWVEDLLVFGRTWGDSPKDGKY